MAGPTLSLFGWEIRPKQSKQEQEEQKYESIVPPTSDDGAVTVSSGAHYGTFVDLDGIARNEVELITRYREMSIQPEIESAIDDIVNESIVEDDEGKIVELNLENTKLSKSLKAKIQKEFDAVLKLLNFQNMGHDIFRRWYIDGRLHYHVIIDEKNPIDGIQELRYIDPRRIRKIREIQKKKDPKTGADIIKAVKEYYLYNDRGVGGSGSNMMGVQIAVDSIANTNSGLMDAKRAMVLSYLHKAIKPMNMLRMVEDATVIYRLSRAPERRIFYIDVGNMPTIKAEQYVRDVMVKYRNKLVYDANTGEIRDDRKHMSMLEDFWLPRREGGKGTEVGTLPGGQNLGKMEDVEYMQKKLYKALGVPVSRIEPQNAMFNGRSTEITRDEIKFFKFIKRLRQKFSVLFDELLEKQLILRQVCNKEEWQKIKEDMWYDFQMDNNFSELLESELTLNRLATLAQIDPFVGKYYSKEWVRKNVLRQSEEDIKEIDEQMAAEMQSGEIIDPNAPPPGMDPNAPPGADPNADPNAQQPQMDITGQPAQEPEITPEEEQYNEFKAKKFTMTPQEVELLNA